MEFQRVSDLTAPDGHAIPGFLLAPASPRGGAVVCHGYGSSKEQMLGIVTAVAEKGIAVLAIDLCGHGENTAPIGPAMRDEMEVAIAFVRRFGRTAVIGHSLGGRLALMSSADVMVAMSPSVMMQMSPQGKWMFENLPSPGLREPYSGYVLELLEKLGPVPSHGRPCLLLYSERDIQAVRSRKYSDLNAPMEEGVPSVILIHLANISYRLGRTLHFDPATLTCTGDAEANRMFTRTAYRAPFVVPEKV